MHCVYLALWTRKVLCGSFYMQYKNESFIHTIVILTQNSVHRGDEVKVKTSGCPH